MSKLLILFAVFVWFVSPATVEAQVRAPSHWGIGASFLPSWHASDKLKIVFDDAQSIDIAGSDFEIGVVRGRDDAGEWGVGLVHRSFDRGGLVVAYDGEQCVGSTCFPEHETLRPNNASLLGIGVHRVIPFATIKHRYQVGLRVGGGIGQMRGTAEREFRRLTSVSTRNGVLVSADVEEGAETVPSSELFLGGSEWFPLFDLQLSAGVLVAPGMKVRVHAGINFPGTQAFSLGAHYLFGSR